MVGRIFVTAKAIVTDYNMSMSADLIRGSFNFMLNDDSSEE